MKPIQTLSLLSFIVILGLSSCSRSGKSIKKNEEPDFCSFTQSGIADRIGKQAKIFDTNGVYTTFIPLIDKFKWPSEEIKRKAEQTGRGNYPLKQGDIGTIIDIYTDPENVSTHIYLLHVSDCYIAVSCGSLVNIDQPDMHERWIEDSLDNLAYAAGCKFKIRDINGVWSRAGFPGIDKASEIFACDLISRGIDTVLLYKSMAGDAYSPNETAFILWQDKGKGYVKAFFNTNDYHQPPIEHETAPFDLRPILNYFFSNRIDTITSDPREKIRTGHDWTYLIQLYTPGSFFREWQTMSALRDDKTHLKSIWWNMILKQLDSLKK